MSDLNQTWKCVAKLEGHSSWLYGVIITPGRMLASVSYNTILFWNLDTQKIDSVLEGHTDRISSLSLSPDSRTLASGSLDKTVCLWNLKTKKLICTLVKRAGPIRSVAFSPNNKLLASGESYRDPMTCEKRTKIYLWSLKRKTLIRTFSGHKGEINSLAFSPDSQTLACGSSDNTVRLWDVNSGRSLVFIEKKHSNMVNINQVAFTPDGGSLIVSGSSGIKIWNVQTRKVQKCLVENTRCRCFAIDPTGQLLAFEVHAGIKIWNLRSGEELKSLHLRYPMSMSFSPDGKLFASGDGTSLTKGLVKVWSVPTLERVADPIEQKFNQSNLAAEHQKLGSEDYFDAETIEDATPFTEGLIKVRSVPKLERVADPIEPNSYQSDLIVERQKLESEEYFDTETIEDATPFTKALIKVQSVPTLEFVADPIEPNSHQSDLNIERQKLESEGYFDAENTEDARRRITVSIVQRQGQAEFRRKLLKYYGGQCPITNCDVESAIEAAHIIPYQGAETNHPTNGLPLRADIHTLFDLHLLSIQPDTYVVVIAPELINTCYQDLAGRKLTLPQDQKAAPDRNALSKHYEIFLSKHKNSQPPVS